ncbi:MAG: beta strand repeat-containing protein [Bacteroidia bacterium]
MKTKTITPILNPFQRKGLALFIITIILSLPFGKGWGWVAVAQAPQGINYQGVARNNLGAAISNTGISVQFQLHQGSAGGAVIFTETQSATTDTFGLFSLVIGSVSTAQFNTINWSAGNLFLQIDINGSPIATTQLMSVPYALYAGSAGSSSSGITSVTGASPITATTTSGAVIVGLATVGTATTVGSSTSIPSFTVDSYGRITGVASNTVATSGGTVTSITTNTTLTGGPITTTGTIGLATIFATGGSVGSATAIPVITYDTYGRITGATMQTFTTSGGTVTSFSTGTGILGGPITTTGTISADNTNPIWNASQLQSTPVTLSAPTTGQVLQYSGTSTGWVNTTPPAGLPSGANGQVMYDSMGVWKGSQANNLFFNGTNMGIGTTTPHALLDITNNSGTTAGLNISINGTSNAANFNITNTVSTSNVLDVNTNGTGNAGNFFITPTGTGNVINATTSGTGIAGNFAMSNAANTNPALAVVTSGTTTTSYSGKFTGGAGLQTDKIQITNGAGTAGQVLTSDAAGNGTWQAASGGVTSVTANAPLSSSGGSTPTISLTTSGVTAGTYGNATSIPQYSVDAYGRIVSSTTVAISPAGVTSVAANSPLSSSGGTTPTISLTTSGVTAGTYGNATSIPQYSVDTYGRIVSSTTVAVGSPTLANANIFVGNAANVATGVPMSGDVAITNTGATKVNFLQGTSVSSVTPTTNQVLEYNGSQWAPGNAGTVTSVIGQSPALSGTVTTSGFITANNSTALWNANQLEGVSVSTVTPTTNQILQYSGTQWVASTPPAAVIGASNGLSVTTGSVELGGTLTQNTTITQMINNMIFNSGGGTGNVQIINGSGGGFNALEVTAAGSGSAISATNTASGNAITGTNSGTAGSAGLFQITNTVSTAPSLFVATSGTGNSAKFSGGLGLQTDNFTMSNTSGTVGAVLTSTNTTGGAAWQMPVVPAPAWALLGNAGTIAATNFIGTTDAVALNFRTNNQKSGVIDPAGATFFGYQAGNSNAGTASNTGFGYMALSSANSTATQNTGVGYAALKSTTGINNTAVGFLTLQANTTGTYNTAMGQGSLQNSSAGNYNTAIGSNTLYSNSSGSNNTVLGWEAGYTTASANANTTGSNNTYIGYSSGAGTATQLTNATAIGANAAVSANNSMVLGSISGINGATASTNVGIGTSTPGALLDIGPSAAGTSLRVTNTNTTGGIAGYFNNTSSTNASPALEVTTSGTGRGIYSHVNSSGNAIYATSSGSGEAIVGFTNGGANAIWGYSNGAGTGVYGYNSSTGIAGYFQINNTANGSPSLQATTSGTGSAGLFQITNTLSTVPALSVSTNGAAGSTAVQGWNSGTGSGGNFQVTNSSSFANALFVSTAGSGNSAKFIGGAGLMTDGLTASAKVITGPYTLLPTDFFIVYSGGTTITVSLPTGVAAGKIYVIKNLNSSTPINISPSYINASGSSITTISGMTTVSLIFDGTNWQQW